MSGQPSLTELQTNQAPSLPAWHPHAPKAVDQRLSAPLASSESDLKKEIEELLVPARDIVNRYLPSLFLQDFEIWIFEDVPFAAKALDPHLILARRILNAHQRSRLPYVLAHEMHHLWLMRIGFLRPQPSARDDLLMGLLSEGVASWLCLQSGLFPELEEVLSDRVEVGESFRRVREALSRPGTGQSGALHHHSKWGYHVGTWMIRSIDAKFGRMAWIGLLDKSPEQAVEDLIDLYDQTEPSDEYRF